MPPYAAHVCRPALRQLQARSCAQAALLCCACTYGPCASCHSLLPMLADQPCGSCAHGPVRKLQLLFRQRSLPMGYEPVLTSCVICDQNLHRLLQTIGGQERRPGALGVWL
jgi:hypothetical protein